MLSFFCLLSIFIIDICIITILLMLLLVIFLIILLIIILFNINIISNSYSSCRFFSFKFTCCFLYTSINMKINRFIKWCLTYNIYSFIISIIYLYFLFSKLFHIYSMMFIYYLFLILFLLYLFLLTFTKWNNFYCNRILIFINFILICYNSSIS